MGDRLRGVETKLNRANEHLDQIRVAIVEFGKSDFYEIATELDYRRRIVGRAVNVQRPGPELGVLIGDCVHCLRSALDHIAYQLAIGHTDPLPERWAKDSAFPIFKSGPRFRGGKSLGRGAGHKLEGMSRSARAGIERLQPYHCRKHPLLRALWQLEELSNIDKHRLIPLTGAIPVKGSMSIKFNRPGVTAFGHTMFPGPIEERRRIVGVTGAFEKADDVEINAEISPDVVFDKRADPIAVRGWPVLAVLNGVFAAIGAHVFSELNPEFRRRLGVTLVMGDAGPPGRSSPNQIEELAGPGWAVASAERG